LAAEAVAVVAAFEAPDLVLVLHLSDHHRVSELGEEVVVELSVPLYFLFRVKNHFHSIS
jgi:hypothetical protein